jgi:hypothetical protein
MLLNFALVNAIRIFQEIKDGLKLNGTHHILVDADDVNVLDEEISIIMINAVVLLNDSKEIVLEVKSEGTKYMFTSRHETAGRIMI